MFEWVNWLVVHWIAIVFCVSLAAAKVLILHVAVAQTTGMTALLEASAQKQASNYQYLYVRRTKPQEEKGDLWMNLPKYSRLHVYFRTRIQLFSSLYCLYSLSFFFIHAPSLTSCIHRHDPYSGFTEMTGIKFENSLSQTSELAKLLKAYVKRASMSFSNFLIASCTGARSVQWLSFWFFEQTGWQD